MAQYKVPQDVEADDKLLGPFSFRQFVYLMIAGGLIATAVGLFQLFPALAIIPVPFAFFFLALALPLKKDQPMETYLAAIVSYYLKPHARVWMPGQRDVPILITAPKKVDDNRTRDITEEEATHRLSFLADIVDTEGYAIKGAGASPMREDLIAEAEATPDMFETYRSQVLNRVIDQDKMSRHQSAVQEMQNAIARNNATTEKLEEPTTVVGERVIARTGETVNHDVQDEIAKALTNPTPEPTADNPVVVAPETEEPVIVKPKSAMLRDDAILKPDIDIDNSAALVKPEIESEKDEADKKPRPSMLNPMGLQIDMPETKKAPAKPVNDSIMELANNSDFSIATIAKEANRINRKEKGEVFISLH